MVDVDPKIRRICDENGYMAPQIMPGDRWCAIAKFLFTTGIIHGDIATIDTTINGRFCYHTPTDAVAALLEWKERGFIGKPVNYITEK